MSGTMKPRLPILLFVPLAVCCALLATDAQTSATSAPKAASKTDLKAEPARLKRDVEWLADDLREGRRAGTAKALECADYIAARLKSLELEPAGRPGYLQEFDVPLAPRTGGRSRIGVDNPSASASGRQILEEGDNFVPLFCSDGGPVTAPAQFVSFAIDDKDRGRDDFAGVDLIGKIAIAVRGVPKSAPPKTPAVDPNAPPSPHSTGTAEPGSEWGGDGLIFTKVMNAKRRGAVGFVLVENPSAHEPLLAFGQGGTARAGIPCAMITLTAARALFTDATVDGWTKALEDTAKLEPTHAGLLLECDVHREKGPARNVLGLLRGLDPSRCIVVGAHYDHLGLGGEGSLAPNDRGQIHHGADDNASGVAAVLEMARILSKGPRPACDVLFALWSGEELGLLGSEWWADHPTLPLDHVAADLNLDMVGRANSGKLQVLAAGTAVPFADWLKDAGPAAGLELQVSTSGNTVGGSSDHATFLKRSIPALHLFSGLHSDYHKPSDTADKFEPEGAAKTADLGVDLVRRMCAAGKLEFVAPKVDPNEKPVRGRFTTWFGSIPNYAYDKTGVLIDGTSAGSPAEHAGFLKGDILTQMGDVKFDSINDFMFALQTYKPGDVVLVKYLRDGKAQETRVTLSTRGQQ
jgi:hypothetical protein